MDSAVADLRQRLGITDGCGDAEAIAVRCGLALCPHGQSGGKLEGATIFYERGAPPEERQRQVARELGRWILLSYGLEVTSFHAYFAGQAMIAGPVGERESHVTAVVR